MKSKSPVYGVSRRAMVSALGILSALVTLRPVSASAQAGSLPSAPPSSGDLPPRGDVLPSWNDTATKKAIVAFVDRVTKQGSPDFVPEAERIATFDNDGTLWAEQPLYFQFLFAIDRLKALARISHGLECIGVSE